MNTNTVIKGELAVLNENLSQLNSETLMSDIVDGTTGTPLGGFGAGAVKFNAVQGCFATTTQPPADQNDYYPIVHSRFQFYSKVNDVIKSSDTLRAARCGDRHEDDAIWPEHRVNFGDINGVTVYLKAFSPIDSTHPDLMSMPYAFYEFTVTNTNASVATISCAFVWNIAECEAQYIINKGFVCDKWAIYATSTHDEAVIASGNDESVQATGEGYQKSNTSEAKVAVSLTLNPNQTEKIKFVLAWYDTTDPDGAYYLSLYKNAGQIAELGLTHFDLLKNNADKLIETMRGSDIPKWFTNQALNSLANISNNSIYKTDGRAAFAEGEWTCFGTMDQMWHARSIIGALCPYFAWKELEYWARTQRHDGQIHHDFTPFDVSDKNPKYKLCGWDDTQHPDYRNIDAWVDLNCGFIISVYETYQQTADKKQLDYFWPYVKKAAKRILEQVELYGDKTFPFTFSTSQNSYDAGGDPNAFNSSISAVTYKIMITLSKMYIEPRLTTIYKQAYETVVESYRQRYLKDNFVAGRISESYFAGQWLALHLKLGQIWSEKETDYVLTKLDEYYHPYYKGLGYPLGTYDEWTPYILSHYGGLLLNTRRQKEYEAMQKDAYNRQYLDRNYVFSQPLDILPAILKTNFVATKISGDKQYISNPSIWRNYYDIIGYHRDMDTKELWLKPNLLDEMNHVMNNAAYISPEGYGTISCTLSGEYYQNNDLIFKPEKPIWVSTLHLTDYFGENLTVTINGTCVDFIRCGEGYSKEIIVTFNDVIDYEAIHIITCGDPGNPPPNVATYVGNAADILPVIPDISAFDKIAASNFSEQAGISISTDRSGIRYITDCNNFDYIKFNNVGFERVGAQYIVLKVSSELTGTTLQVVLDSVGGDAIATIEIPCTNGPENWIEITSAITKTTGTHNVLLRFFGNSEQNLVNIAELSFLKSNHFEYIDRSHWTATASRNASSAFQAFDNISNTRWHTSYQTGDEWFLLDMAEQKCFDKIVLDSTPKENEYPRHYEIYVSTDGEHFSDCIASSAGTNAITAITFPIQNARYIKICQTAKCPTHYWSIYDLNVYNTSLRPK